MKKNKLEYIFIAATLISGFLSFFSIFRAIKVENSSTWIVPMVWFSVFILSLFLMTIFVKNKLEVEIIALIASLFSLAFAFSLGHFLISIVCILFLLSGLSDVRNDLDMNVKISLWKSLYTGKFKIIFSLALLISSQYFYSIKNINGQINVPQLDLSGISTKIAKPIFGEINPGYKAISDEKLTVDQYIIRAQEKNGDDPVANFDLGNDDSIVQEIPKNLPQAQQDSIRNQALQMRSQAQAQLSEKNKELMMQEARAQLSKVFGQQLTGNELMADVIVSPIGISLNHFFQPGFNGDNQSPIFPLILTVVLFFTLWPIGSLLSVFWFFIVILIFKLFVKTNLVKVERITVERERITF